MEAKVNLEIVVNLEQGYVGGYVLRDIIIL